MRRVIAWTAFAGWAFVAGTAARTEAEITATTDSKETTKPHAALRFDGIYVPQGGRLGTSWRFFPDGTAKSFFGSPVSPEVAAMNLVRYGTDYSYKLTGNQLEVLQDGSAGTVEVDRLRLRRGDFSYECQFVHDDALKGATPQSSPTVVASSPTADLALGQATMDSSCQKVEFKPMAAPARLPGAAAEVAYQISLHHGASPSAMPDTRVEDNLRCSTAGLQSRQCNKYAILMGEPAVVSSTIIVSCKDGKPFRPGAYELSLIVGDRRSKTIAFTIEGPSQ